MLKSLIFCADSACLWGDGFLPSTRRAFPTVAIIPAPASRHVGGSAALDPGQAGGVRGIKAGAALDVAQLPNPPRSRPSL